MFLDLYHGECRDAKFIKDSDDEPHEFQILATEEDWHDLMTGKIEESKALMSGKFKITGNISKLMRFPKAAAYIIKYLKKLLKDWN